MDIVRWRLVARSSIMDGCLYLLLILARVNLLIRVLRIDRTVIVLQRYDEDLIALVISIEVLWLAFEVEIIVDQDVTLVPQLLDRLGRAVIDPGVRLTRQLAGIRDLLIVIVLVEVANLRVLILRHRVLDLPVGYRVFPVRTGGVNRITTDIVSVRNVARHRWRADNLVGLLGWLPTIVLDYLVVRLVNHYRVVKFNTRGAVFWRLLTRADVVNRLRPFLRGLGDRLGAVLQDDLEDLLNLWIIVKGGHSGWEAVINQDIALLLKRCQLILRAVINQLAVVAAEFRGLSQDRIMVVLIQVNNVGTLLGRRLRVEDNLRFVRRLVGDVTHCRHGRFGGRVAVNRRGSYRRKAVVLRRVPAIFIRDQVVVTGEGQRLDAIGRGGLAGVTIDVLHRPLDRGGERLGRVLQVNVVGVAGIVIVAGGVGIGLIELVGVGRLVQRIIRVVKVVGSVNVVTHDRFGILALREGKGRAVVTIVGGLGFEDLVAIHALRILGVRIEQDNRAFFGIPLVEDVDITNLTLLTRVSNID